MQQVGHPVFLPVGLKEEIILKKLLCMVSVLVLLTAMLTGCGSSARSAGPASSGSNAAAGAGKDLTVKMLDVGQGDAILIRTAEQTILIDTGDTDEHEKFAAALKKEGVKTVDKLIITHPHADHLGGASVVFKECEVRAVYDNGQTTNSKLYREYLKTIKAKGIAYQALRDGDTLDFGSGVSFKVLSPTEEMVKEGGKNKDGKVNLNLNSVVGRLTYGNFSTLFTGDAEQETEAGILQRHKAEEIKSLVLKSPHHGSKTSSSPAYLKAAAPEAALISLGAGNEYHHPHQVTLDKYAKMKMKVWRTDQNGTITVTSNGQGYEIKWEK